MKEFGQPRRVVIDMKSRTVRLVLSPKNEHTSQARLRVEQPAQFGGDYAPKERFVREREAWTIPLLMKQRMVELINKR